MTWKTQTEQITSNINARICKLSTPSILEMYFQYLNYLKYNILSEFKTSCYSKSIGDLFFRVHLYYE